MKIYINNIEAIVKKGTSFDYIAENRYFTGADDYTMAITFPMKGCRVNQNIFGNINRKDILASRILYDCEIVDSTFKKKGAITITEIMDDEIKCQFLEGRSVNNFKNKLDEIYINELDLGEPAYHEYVYNPVYLRIMANNNSHDYVALPWVNNSSGNVQNRVKFGEHGIAWDFQDPEAKLSFQPYLIFITKNIFEAIGYKYDLTEWENSKWYDLLVCNAVPAAWESWKWQTVLPKWTVMEFINEIEKLMNADIIVDNDLLKISFRFWENKLSMDNVYHIGNPLNEYSVEFTEENESEYSELRDLEYKEDSHSIWKYYTADWIIDNAVRNVVENGIRYYVNSFDHATDMIDWMNFHKGASWWYGSDVGIEYAIDEDIFATHKVAWRYQLMGKEEVVMRSMPIGVFRKIMRFGDVDNQTDEISMVPALIDFVDREIPLRNIIILECGEYDNVDLTYEGDTKSATLIEKGKAESKEVFDKLYVGFYNAQIAQSFVTQSMIPCPVIDYCTLYYVGGDATALVKNEYSLRLKNGTRKESGIAIDAKKKFKINFIDYNIPDVTSVFHINGKYFLCKKLTATFREDGMSQLIKGEFYRIIYNEP